VLKRTLAVWNRSTPQSRQHRKRHDVQLERAGLLKGIMLIARSTADQTADAGQNGGEIIFSWSSSFSLHSDFWR